MANQITLQKDANAVTLQKGTQQSITLQKVAPTITLTQSVLVGSNGPIGLPTDGTWDGLAAIVATNTVADAVSFLNEAALNIVDGTYGFHTLKPAADVTYDLGDGTTPKRWRSIYLGPSSLHISSTAAETTTARDYRWGIVTTTADGEQGFAALYEAGTAGPLLAVSPAGDLYVTGTVSSLQVVASTIVGDVLYSNGTLEAVGATTLRSTLNVTGVSALGVLNAGVTTATSLTVSGAADWYFGNAVIANLEPTPVTVRYAARGFSNSLGVGASETAALYMRVDPASTLTYGIYGEVTSSQTDTHGALIKIVHNGQGDAFYTAMYGSGGVAYEAASFVNGSRGIISTLQRTSGSGTDFGNSTSFTALWGDDGTGGSTTPANYGMFYAARSLGNSLRTQKQDASKTGASDGRIEWSISEFDFSRDRIQIYNTGEMRTLSPLATSGQHFPFGAPVRLVSAYWTAGGATADAGAKLITTVNDNAGTCQLDISLGAVGSEALALSILASGIRWGSTTSYPYLKRNGAALNVRLGDDSADANLTAANLTASGTLAVTGTSTLGATNTGALTATTGSFSSTLGVTGTTTLGVTNTGAFTGTTGSFSSTLAVTGTSTLGATNTGAFTGTTGSFSSTLGVTGATTLAAMSATTGSYSGQLTLSAGSQTAPALCFPADQTGIYQLATSTFGFAFAGAKGMLIAKSGNVAKIQNLSAAANGNGFQFYADNDVLCFTADPNGIVSRTGGITSANQGGFNTSTGRILWQGAAANSEGGVLNSATVLSGTLSGATVTLSNLIPAGAQVVAVVGLIKTTITGATSLSVGDGTTATLFSNASGLTGTFNSSVNGTMTGPKNYASATSVVLTANGSNFTGGVVRVTVFYLNFIAPTT